MGCAVPGELVLVIEDNERNSRLVRDVLEHAGMRVCVAATGAEGLERARVDAPDLVLLDVGLPDTDGVAVLGELRADARTSRVPIVAVTAYAMSGDKERLLRAGFDGYIAKPIEVATFASEVASYLHTEVPPAPAPTPTDPSHVTVLVVDDTPANARLLEEMLTARSYRVVVAANGAEALRAVSLHRPQLVLLDVQLPDFDGFEVCRRLRSDPRTATLPIVMVTASVGQERVRALEVGADDFLTKPFDQAELVARIQSLVRVQEFQERIKSQADQLAVLNRTLKERVDAQISEMERLRRLRRFVSEHVADAILSSGSDAPLRFHRSEIAVLFSDLRGFTAFSGNAEPEESAAVMSQYHDMVGQLVRRFDATVGHFAGDGVMLFFNDPVPCPEPAATAVRMGVALRDGMRELSEAWRRRGHELGCGIGIAFGFATVGEMGFEGRRDYGAIGSVCNLASRLCDEAEAGQIVIAPRVHAAVENLVSADPLPPLFLKGFTAPVDAWLVRGLEEERADG
jgi:adenylate cyclase